MDTPATPLLLDILLVEDSPTDVMMTREALKENRMLNPLHVVQDGVAAMQFLRRDPPYTDAPRPGLILLDLNLPRKSGPEVLAEAGRRRAFAVISHPDAGKSTLTEALALHASAITQAGAVHGKAGRRGVTSDWMAMERDRGISITSAALRFDYGGMVLNLLDTPGHADFSEDTYRVLEAVDCAIMLLDSAKGLEPQTLKLFDVCRNRRVPVITFVNKWDRPGREPLGAAAIMKSHAVAINAYDAHVRPHLHAQS